MYGNFTLCDYTEQTSDRSVRGYAVNFNCYHVKLNKKDDNGITTSEIVFQRDPKNSNWMDERHQAICKAFNALEAALLAVIEDYKEVGLVETYHGA